MRKVISLINSYITEADSLGLYIYILRERKTLRFMLNNKHLKELTDNLVTKESYKPKSCFCYE